MFLNCKNDFGFGFAVVVSKLAPTLSNVVWFLQIFLEDIVTRVQQECPTISKFKAPTTKRQCRSVRVCLLTCSHLFWRQSSAKSSRQSHTMSTAVRAGYFEDELLRAFVRKPRRRTALINRGCVWARVQRTHALLAFTLCSCAAVYAVMARFFIVVAQEFVCQLLDSCTCVTTTRELVCGPAR